MDDVQAPQAGDDAPLAPAASSAVTPAATSAVNPAARHRLTGEVVLVLSLSLGASAVYAVVSLIAKYTRGSLKSQTATLNASVSPRPWLDLTYQLLDIGFTLVPVALVIWLFAAPPANLRAALERLGLRPVRAGRDLLAGAALAAVIGLPGIGLYLVGREIGATVQVVAESLNPVWWAVPVLVLQAVKNAVLEEVIVVAYLLRRLEDLGVGARARTAISAVLRGSYHLYQGPGAFVGNAVMGVVFAEWFRRRGRVVPLVLAHTILDVFAFVGYRLFAHALGL